MHDAKVYPSTMAIKFSSYKMKSEMIKITEKREKMKEITRVLNGVMYVK